MYSVGQSEIRFFIGIIQLVFNLINLNKEWKINTRSKKLKYGNQHLMRFFFHTSVSPPLLLLN